MSSNLFDYLEKDDLAATLDAVRTRALSCIDEYFAGADDEYQIDTQLMLSDELEFTGYNAQGFWLDNGNHLAYATLSADNLLTVLEDLEKCTDEPGDEEDGH